MGYKIFVSYKYKDYDVASLPGIAPPTWPCDYVDYIRDNILNDDDIYKGENSDEDISSWGERQIEEHLKAKIFDSSITIVLISPNMKEPNKHEKSQWIPWEISYSLRLTTRNNRTSQRNAILAVVLPDKRGTYDYYSASKLFPILQRHIKLGYIYVAHWDLFKKYPDYYIKKAIESRDINKLYVTPNL